MTRAAQMTGSPWLDENRRLAWIGPLALGLWLALLAAFARLLTETAPPPPQLNAVEARIVELPPPAGLQSGPATTHAPTPPKPAPHAVHHVAPRVMPRRAPTHPITPAPPSMEGTAKTAPASAPTAGAPAAKSSTGPPAEPDAGGLTGAGNDSSGARALYAPAPEIPDDLREDTIDTVAVAHFEVASDGQAQVTLTQPTPNSRLNDLLLETLRQWRFAPATRNGIAIESRFDIRIPVTVQ